MIKKLQPYPWFLLLMPLFFVLHAANENYGLIALSIPFEYFAYYFILSCCLLAISFFLFRRKDKAYVYTIFLLAIFFFFAPVHDSLKSSPLPPIVSTYKVLLPLITLLLLGAGLYIKRSSKSFYRLTAYTHLLFIIFLAIDGCSIAFKCAMNDKYVSDLGEPSKKLSKDYIPCDTCQKPDIYFIVFDAYASSLCLKEEFAFENKAVDSVLLNNQFFISTQSKSNYNITPFSIASTFNLNYLQPWLGNKTLTGKMLLQSEVTVYYSELPVILQKEGYAIKNYSVFNFKNHPSHSSPYFEGPAFGGIEKKVIPEQTLAGRIRKDIWWNTGKLTSDFDSPKLATTSLAFEKDWSQRYVYDNINSLLHEAKTSSGKPKFVYMHVETPHEPYIFDEKGGFNKYVIWTHDEEQSYYLSQLKYANTLLIKIINELMADKTKPRIIIIEGDHGFRNYASASKKNKIFCNLNAYYFPDHDYSNLYDSISPVNTFRVILNKYFNQALPLLPDSSVYIRDATTKFEKQAGAK